MKKDLIESLSQKLSECKVAPPEGLWENIAADISSTATSKPVVFKRLAAAISSAAASVAILVGIVAWFLSDGELTTTEPTNNRLAVNHIDTKQAPEIDIDDFNSEEYYSGEAVEPAVREISRITSNAAAQTHSSAAVAPADGLQEKIITTEPVATEIVEEPTDSAPGNVYTASSYTLSDERQHAICPAKESLPHPVSKQLKSWRNSLAYSVFATDTNFPRFSGDSDFATNLPDPDTNPEEPGETTSDCTSAPTRGGDEAGCISAQHKQPIRVGFSVRFPLPSRFSITTGITYTFLSSTLQFTHPAREYDQSLHYLGIPLSVDYSLPSYRALSFYLTAGGMLEKCIHGTRRDIRSSETLRVIDKNLQPSVFAGAGIQVNFLKHLAIYIEPLATYHFDNGCNIRNTYYDRPFNFDLRLGLRYTPYRQANTSFKPSN